MGSRFPLSVHLTPYQLDDPGARQTGPFHSDIPGRAKGASDEMIVSIGLKLDPHGATEERISSTGGTQIKVSFY